MRNLWAIYVKQDGQWEKTAEYKTFTEAMSVLQTVAGEWHANWGVKEIGKGDYSLLPII